MLMLAFAASGQTRPRSDKDDRNTAPTVGTGGAVGGPTGLFTIYDGQTLRKGEWTVSLALSNYDRDPGNADFTDFPASFQIGLTNRLELFFNTNVYRQLKINSPRQISGTYLPNAQGYLLPAVVLAPEGPGANAFAGQAVFRPAGMPFAAFPFTGAGAGRYGYPLATPVFGFAGGTQVTLGAPRTGATGNAAFFPGVGSVFGSILPGIVLTTNTVTPPFLGTSVRPVTFTAAPSYLPDAPFASRSWATSSLNSFDVGVKWRFNSPNSATGAGVVLFYTWYPDHADDAAGFNQLQRGAGPGASRGDFGGSFFVDSRLRSWVNLSANVGYKFTTNPKGSFGGSDVTLLDRPDELTYGVGVDFPVNKHFQPILEFRGLRYMRSQTPNAFQVNPMDGLAGIRIFPSRNWGMSFAYRINFNQQDVDSFGNTTSTTNVLIPCTTLVAGCQTVSTTVTREGIPQGFIGSTDPHGYMAQFFFGHRQDRSMEIPNKPADVTAVSLSDTRITLPCGPGQRSRSGACNDSRTVSVSTTAVDPENDVLTYNYTVSGGRIVGTGSNVTWDLGDAQPGTYTITTGVNDGCGVCGKTNTQTITVETCPDCVTICECPTLTVSGPGGTTGVGSPMTFTANLSGSASVTYNWTVSAGTISSGQGSSSISVDTTGLAPGSNVTATVNISGLDPNCNCTTSVSEVGSIAEAPRVTEFDQFGQIPNDEVKARVDNFFVALNNDPNARGFIINYGTPAQIKARRAQIDKAIAFRKYDRSRVTFIDGPDQGSGINTKFYLVPAGATEPQP
jgi:hypothetical protein